MAHHEEESPGMVHEFGMTPLTWWLAALAGTGMTLMIVAAAIGVITGQGVGVLFALGALMLIGGGAAWIGVTKPFANFDDISKPIDGGHHDIPAATHGEQIANEQAEADARVLSHAPAAPKTPADEHSSEVSHTKDAHAPAHH